MESWIKMQYKYPEVLMLTRLASWGEGGGGCFGIYRRQKIKLDDCDSSFFFTFIFNVWRNT